MPEHNDWFSLLLGHTWERLTMFAQGTLGKTWVNHDPISVHHVASALLVFLIILVLAIRAAGQKNRATNPLIPDRTLTARNFFELLAEGLLSQMENQMGRERAKKYFPLIASFATFILFCNCLGLIPGFIPPTETLDTTAALGVTSFLAFNIYGLGAQGAAYLKHFCGPVLPDLSKPKTYPALLLVALMLPIEIIGTFARALSLSVRLMVNLFADHTILGIFYGLFAFVLPVPLMVLGVLVCIVQTVVFTLLSIVYIALATEHHDHGDDHGHAGEHAEAHAHGH